MKTIYDLTIISNRADYKVKPRICHGTFIVSGNQAIFELEESRNWFARHHFVLNEGYTVIPEGSDKAYTITGITFPDKRPFHPILTTVQASPEPLPVPRKRGWPAHKPRKTQQSPDENLSTPETHAFPYPSGMSRS